MVHFRKAGTAGLLPVGHHQGSGPSDAKFVRLSNPAGVMGGGGGSQYGDTGSVGGGDAAQRKNHSQIEKKRRDRMNTYIKVLNSRYVLAFSNFGSEKMCVFKVILTNKALSVGNDCVPYIVLLKTRRFLGGTPCPLVTHGSDSLLTDFATG